LNGFFVATTASGQSAFNRVERKMAPFIREISGLILPYDHYRTHLDNQSQTIDLDLEKRNFAFAGSTLAEIWSKFVADEFPTLAEYIKPKA
jgi:hypothetical protein